MKAVIVEKPGQVILRNREMGPLQSGFVRIRVRAAAVCATDLELVSGGIAANFPVTPGHEWAGDVIAVADPENAHWIGKRVTGCNDVVCGQCTACRSGEWRYCKDFQEIGFKRDGAYAEFVDIPAYGLVELPDDLPYTHAALAEPLGVGLGMWEKLDGKAGKTCLIFGAGSIGLCCLAVAKAMGLRKIVVAAASDSRLEVARTLGAWKTIATKEEDLFEAMAQYHPEGTDYIIDATGMESCISASFKLCKKGGYVGLAGYGRGKIMQIRMDDIHINNLHVVGGGNNWNQHRKAIHMMADGQVDMAPFVTNVMKLEDYNEALELARTRPVGFVKAVFTFD